MARPGYLSLYADDKTQKIFDEFTKMKGIKKTEALSQMLEIYMLSTDEKLYLDLKKKSLGLSEAKSLILTKEDARMINDYIFLKLTDTATIGGDVISGDLVIKAYMKSIETHGYSWFSTHSLHFGMAQKKVDYYNQIILNGEKVKILFALGSGVNEICYSATVTEIVSAREDVSCPGDAGTIPAEFGRDETGRIWFKLEEINEEHDIKAENLVFRSNGHRVKDAISHSQLSFGYVYLK